MSRQPIQCYSYSNLITFKAHLFNVFKMSDIITYNNLSSEFKILENWNLHWNYEKHVLMFLHVSW